MSKTKPKWKLSEWNEHFSKENPPPMTQTEIKEGIQFLRANNYPKPIDCPGLECPKLRPACKLDICQIAAGMCGDF